MKYASYFPILIFCAFFVMAGVINWQELNGEREELDTPFMTEQEKQQQEHEQVMKQIEKNDQEIFIRRKRERLK